MATTCPRVLQKAAGGDEDQHVQSTYSLPGARLALEAHFLLSPPLSPKKTNTPVPDVCSRFQMKKLRHVHRHKAGEWQRRDLAPEPPVPAVPSRAPTSSPVMGSQLSLALLV